MAYLLGPPDPELPVKVRTYLVGLLNAVRKSESATRFIKDRLSSRPYSVGAVVIGLAQDSGEAQLQPRKRNADTSRSLGSYQSQCLLDRGTETRVRHLNRWKM